MFKFLPTLLILLCLAFAACGEADEPTPAEDPDPSKDLVGTWELITIDGETPIADAQKNLKTEAAEMLAVDTKIVFAEDGDLFQEAALTLRVLIEPKPNLVYLKTRVRQTVEGSYVVSGTTLELIRSGDDVKITTHTSWETPGNPELKQQLEQDSFSQELKEGFDAGLKEELQKNVDNWALQLKTNTFHIENNTLTLSSDTEMVYKKR